MADINLLPDDFRRDEKREKERARKKKSTDEEIRLTEPENGDKDTTNKFWKKVLRTDSEKKSDAVKVHGGTPLEQAVAKSFSKKARQTPNFLTKEVSSGEEKKSSISESEINDILDGDFILEETKGEKQAKTLRKRGPILEGEVLKKDEEKAPKILIEKDDKKDSLLSKLKKIQSAIVKFLEKLLNRYGSQRVEVNLMPEQVVGLSEVNWKKIVTNMLSVIIISVIIIIAGYTGILSRIRIEQQSFNNLQLKIEDLSSQISAFSEQLEKAFATEQELATAKKLLNNHILWTQFLNFLEESTLDSVQYIEFVGTVDSPITLNATADSIETIVLQRQIFMESLYVSNVKLIGYSKKFESDLINFELEVTFNTSIWRRS